MCLVRNETSFRFPRPAPKFVKRRKGYPGPVEVRNPNSQSPLELEMNVGIRYLSSSIHYYEPGLGRFVIEVENHGAYFDGLA
jgi:hypothetical protein